MPPIARPWTDIRSCHQRGMFEPLCVAIIVNRGRLSAQARLYFSALKGLQGLRSSDLKALRPRTGRERP